MTDLNLKIGLEVLRSYRRLAYTPWYALAEFVDNSTQSYRDHKELLERAYKAEQTHLSVTIDYNRDAGRLVVSDNAMGMSFEELERALQIGKPPPNTSGRSQYGLGLKTAACWFGDKWSVRTKKLGELRGYVVTVDVDRVASGNQQSLPTEDFEAPASDHYTEIAISALHVKMQGRGLGKTRKTLSSMYRADIKRHHLKIIWEKELRWQEDLDFLELPDGTKQKRIEFKVGERTVRGWVSVLARGSSSRGNAGFALIRRGRLVRGAPESWRPEAIFGLGRNDLINQRVTGEINLDEFDVTHTKDDILWQDAEEDEVQDGIKERIDDVLRLAREYRHEKPKEQPSVDRKLAMDSAVQDTDLGPRMTAAGHAVEGILASLRPKAIEASYNSLLQSVARAEPLLSTEVVGGVRVNVITTTRLTSDGPYMIAQTAADGGWLLVVNAAHPVCAMLDDVEALRVHVQHAVADGLVMWVCATGKALAYPPSTTAALKDALLRIMSEDRK